MIATLLMVMGVVLLLLRLLALQPMSRATGTLVGRIVKAAVLVPLVVALAVVAMGL